LDVSLVALVAGAAVLVVSPAKPGELMRMVDWVLLLFFAGLFIVIGGAREAGVLDVFLDRIALSADMAGIVSIHIVSAIASQLVSNVPLTLLAVPLLERAGSDLLWLSLASSATLAGNLTIIGAVANIIVVEGAAKEGITVPWGEFFRVGAVVTALTVLASIGILALEWQLGWVG
jgi:Na+/H+ antiporter NhaD/arsenite permease-like protein